MEQKEDAVANRKPAQKFRLGRLNAAIWERQDAQGQFQHTVTLARTYKDSEGGCRDTGSLDVSDLAHAILLLDLAQKWILNRNPAEYPMELPETLLEPKE